MDKLEKLKEVNKTIRDICVDLETRLFVENVDGDNDNVINGFKPEVLETK